MTKRLKFKERVLLDPIPDFKPIDEKKRVPPPCKDYLIEYKTISDADEELYYLLPEQNRFIDKLFNFDFLPKKPVIEGILYRIRAESVEEKEEAKDCEPSPVTGEIVPNLKVNDWLSKSQQDYGDGDSVSSKRSSSLTQSSSWFGDKISYIMDSSGKNRNILAAENISKDAVLHFIISVCTPNLMFKKWKMENVPITSQYMDSFDDVGELIPVELFQHRQKENITPSKFAALERAFFDAWQREPSFNNGFGKAFVTEVCLLFRGSDKFFILHDVSSKVAFNTRVCVHLLQSKDQSSERERYNSYHSKSSLFGRMVADAIISFDEDLLKVRKPAIVFEVKSEDSFSESKALMQLTSYTLSINASNNFENPILMVLLTAKYWYAGVLNDKNPDKVLFAKHELVVKHVMTRNFVKFFYCIESFLNQIES